MDLRTGRMYESREAALADGVPESDRSEVVLPPDETMPVGRRAIIASLRRAPEVRFASGPFKARAYKRTATGQLVRVR